MSRLGRRFARFFKLCAHFLQPCSKRSNLLLQFLNPTFFPAVCRLGLLAVSEFSYVK